MKDWNTFGNLEKVNLLHIFKENKEIDATEHAAIQQIMTVAN